MPRALEGKYRAKVLPFTFEKVGEKETPMMKANFQPIGQVVDKEVKVEGGLPKVNKGYFLSLDIVTQGKYSGKSKMEALKIQLEENFGYTGPLDPEKINAHVEGMERDIVCKKNEKTGYTEVQYINVPGQEGKGGGKPKKLMDANELAAFAKEFDKGSAKPMPAADAKSLFAQLTGAQEAKPDGQ
jgi:hypothetical protein